MRALRRLDRQHVALQGRVAQLHDVPAGRDRRARHRVPSPSRATTKCPPPVPSPRSTAVVLSSTRSPAEHGPDERRVVDRARTRSVVIRGHLEHSASRGRVSTDRTVPQTSLIARRRPAMRRATASTEHRQRVAGRRSTSCSSVPCTPLIPHASASVGNAHRREHVGVRAAAGGVEPRRRGRRRARGRRQAAPAGSSSSPRSPRTRGSSSISTLPPRSAAASAIAASIAARTASTRSRVQRAALAGHRAASGHHVGGAAAFGSSRCSRSCPRRAARVPSTDRVGGHADRARPPAPAATPAWAARPRNSAANV